MKMKSGKNTIELNMNGAKKKLIIEIYALKICKLWDYYGEIKVELEGLHNSQELTDTDYFERLKNLVMETKSMLSTLCIEQYYNTGDESLFDRALYMKESIELSPVSQINMNELEFSEEMDRQKPVVIYYNGMFINALDVTRPVLHKQYSELLFREPEVVHKINKKLNRARTILVIDEATLGKKYYDGLCMRSHYM